MIHALKEQIEQEIVICLYILQLEMAACQLDSKTKKKIKHIHWFPVKKQNIKLNITVESLWKKKTTDILKMFIYFKSIFSFQFMS